LDALFPSWRDRVIGISSDGENTMTGRIQGVVTRLVSQATNKVVRVWCIPHQMDIEVRGGSEELDGGRWVKSIYTLSVYLRAQLNLITELGVQCPKKTNRWVHLGLVIDLSSTNFVSCAILPRRMRHHADRVPRYCRY
jgi:hypothetical protein